MDHHTSGRVAFRMAVPADVAALFQDSDLGLRDSFGELPRQHRTGKSGTDNNIGPWLHFGWDVMRMGNLDLESPRRNFYFSHFACSPRGIFICRKSSEIQHNVR
jgi:hypothetical protein